MAIDDPLSQDFEMTDLLAASEVEVYIDITDKLWVNINGKCLLRVGKVHNLVLRDERKRK